ncbi:hypothetical protein MKZ07_22350 [Paenibacillus sp. FSL P4-0338]|nr:hypothetical protein [Paenibacillus sp. FSL R7-269]
MKTFYSEVLQMPVIEEGDTSPGSGNASSSISGTRKATFWNYTLR